MLIPLLQTFILDRKKNLGDICWADIDGVIIPMTTLTYAVQDTALKLLNGTQRSSRFTGS